jgi:hypothetical protein
METTYPSNGDCYILLGQRDVIAVVVALFRFPNPIAREGGYVWRRPFMVAVTEQTDEPERIGLSEIR